MEKPHTPSEFNELAKKITVSAEQIVESADNHGMEKDEVLRELETEDFSSKFDSVIIVLGSSADPSDPALQAIAFDAIRQAMDGGLNASQASRAALIMAVNQVYSRRDQSMADLYTKEGNEITEGHANEALQTTHAERDGDEFEQGYEQGFQAGIAAAAQQHNENPAAEPAAKDKKSFTERVSESRDQENHLAV